MNTRRYVNLIQLHRRSFLCFVDQQPNFFPAKIFVSGVVRYGLHDISRGAKSTTAPVALALVRSSD